MSRRTYEHIFSEKSKESLTEFIEASKFSEEYQNLERIKLEFKKWEPFIKNLAEITELQNLGPQKLSMEQCSIITNPDSSQFTDKTQKKDFLEDVTEDKLSPYYLVNTLQKEPIDKIQETYRNAVTHIDTFTIIEMGNLIIKMNSSDLLIQCYCRELLFKMMSEKIDEDFTEIFNTLHAYQCTLVTEQIIHFLKVHDRLDIFLVYLNSKSATDKEFSSSLLRKFLESSEGSLSSKDLFLLDYFISKHTEYDLIQLAVSILSNNAMKFHDNKDYGKLLMKIVESLGPQIRPLKIQIDYILSNHTSIWKIKIKKKIEKLMQEY